MRCSAGGIRMKDAGMPITIERCPGTRGSRGVGGATGHSHLAV
jgi:hypothetical protein